MKQAAAERGMFHKMFFPKWPTEGNSIQAADQYVDGVEQQPWKMSVGAWCPRLHFRRHDMAVYQ